MALLPSIWHLARLDLFQNADESDLSKALSGNVEVLKIAKRRAIEVDERGEFAYGLSEGLAKVCRMSRSGRKVVDTLLRPGDLFGGLEGSGKRRESTIETITDCVLVRVRSADLRQYLSTRPDLLMTCVQLLEDRQRKLSRQVESLVFKDVAARVVETLVQLTVQIPEKCPYGGKGIAGMAVDCRVTQSDLAELVGASRQAVNRVLRMLEAKDVLHRHGRVLCVPDVQALSRLGLT
jgi:CRP-like cAMP-binding protein